MLVQAKLNLIRLWKPTEFPVVFEFFYFFSFLFLFYLGRALEWHSGHFQAFLLSMFLCFFPNRLFLLAVRYWIHVVSYRQLSQFFPESSSFSSDHLVSAPNPQGDTYHGFFQHFFINFIIFEISKRQIKQEVDLVLLFELFSTGKCKTEQSNWYIFNRNLDQSNCTIHGRELAWFLHTVYISRSKDGEHGFQFTAKRIVRCPF